MKVWLIYPYGPIPGEGWRDYRATMIAGALVARGHQVTWWTANYSHHLKIFRSSGWKDFQVYPGFRICLVPTVGYRKNIGVGRLLFQRTYAKELFARAVCEDPPDLIIVGEPPHSAGCVAKRLGRRFAIPVVFDVLDLWPELFSIVFPPFLRSISKLLFLPLYFLRRRNIRLADAVIAACKTYLETALRDAPFLKEKFSACVYWGVDVKGVRESNPSISGEVTGWREKEPGEVWAIYAGSLGNNYDIMTLLRAAKKLKERRSPLIILIAGTGPLKEQVIRFIETNNLDNTRYLGIVKPEILSGLYRDCDIGLCTYSPESTVAMPIKLYDYLAAGLPIVSSLLGELEDFLREERIGLQYLSGDAESLSRALEMLAKDEVMRLRMAKISYDGAMKFDQAVQYAKLVEIAEKVCSGRKASAATAG